LIGNPGVGKSTFGIWYIYMLMNDKDQKYQTVIYICGEAPPARITTADCSLHSDYTTSMIIIDLWMIITEIMVFSSSLPPRESAGHLSISKLRRGWG